MKWKAENTRIAIPPRPLCDGRATMVADPDGIWVELMGPRRAKKRSREARPRT